MRARRVLILLTCHIIVDEIGRHSPVAANSNRELQGWHGQLSDMAVCISINGLPDHESTASRLSIRAASSQPGCAHASTLCGSTLAWTLQGLLQSFHDPGCRLHILRCEPRCAMMHVSAVVIRCKSSLSRTVTPAHQDACRCRYILSVYTMGPGIAPVPINYLTILQ